MRHVFFLAYKLMVERKRQSIVSLMGVVVGFAAFVVMSSIMFGFQGYFIQQVVDIDAHMRIKAREEKRRYEGDIPTLVLGEEVQKKDRLIGWKELIERIRKDPEVEGVAPHLVSKGILRYGVREKPVTLIGIDPQLEEKASVLKRFLRGKGLEEMKKRKDVLIVGALVARDLGVAEGKKVILSVPEGSVSMVVVDIMDSGITNIDDSRVYISLSALQALLQRPGEVNELVVKLKDPSHAEKVARRWKSMTSYEVESWQKAYRNFLTIFRIQNIITYMIVVAILTVSAFGIFNIIMMTVLEKRKEIAILMAMGYSRREITLVFLLQGVLLGVGGVMIGSLLAFGLQEYLSSVKLDVEGLIRTKGFLLDRSPTFYLLGAGFSLLFCVVASFYPSYRAGKLNPVDIFRSG